MSCPGQGPLAHFAGFDVSNGSSPALPQVALLNARHMPRPSQHPLGHEAALHEHAPFEQVAAVPHRPAGRSTQRLGQGATMRPGAPLAPEGVWQALQLVSVAVRGLAIWIVTPFRLISA